MVQIPLREAAAELSDRFQLLLSLDAFGERDQLNADAIRMMLSARTLEAGSSGSPLMKERSILRRSTGSCDKRPSEE